MKKISFIIFILIVIVFSLSLSLKPVIFSPKASGPASFSPQNSYLFASPITAKADNQEKIRLTIFVLDTRGLGIPGINILLKSSTSLNQTIINSITDDTGRAIFDLSTSISGTYFIEATANSSSLPQKLKISFY